MYVIATAGHVDHGKSTLIRALTSMEPDRWAEERRRGMTIDLGYAWTTLASGKQIAFVDVPGHQRFITNMLAGVGPVPAVLLVVAADEGWGRQTSEHLAALDALGIEDGLLVVTRSDLADPALAIEEAESYLAGSSLAGIRAVAVSGVTGAGLDELRTLLEELTSGLRPTPTIATRLWIDRVFTIRGAGTVVTGTLSSGSITVDDELVLASSGETVRVRALERMKDPVTRVDAPARLAINVRGLKRTDIQRGDALLVAGGWLPVTSMDVRLRNVVQVPGRPIMHIGSAAVEVRFRPLGPDTARLSWESPLPIRIGERAVLRDPGPQRVVAGIIVLDVLPPALSRRGAAALRAAELEAMTGQIAPGDEVRRQRVIRRSELVAAGAWQPSAPLPASALAFGDWLVHDEQWAAWQHILGAAVDQWAADHPLQPGLSRSTAAQLLGAPDVALIDRLVRAAGGLVSDGDGIHRPGAVASVPPAVREALDAVRARLIEAPFAAPEMVELRAAGLSDQHLAVATKAGELLRLAPGVYLAPDAIEQARVTLASLPQPFTLSAARQALGTTRRVAVPLLELLDQQRVTERVDAQLRTIAVGGGI